jgi:hypothetical protein
MKTTLVILLVLVVATGSLRAQIESQGLNRPLDLGATVYGIGGSIGAASGFGFSFREHFPTILSYQIVAGAYRTSDVTAYDIGGELQFDVMRGVRNRFFGVVAAGYFYSGDNNNNNLAAPWREGIGIGNEWLTETHLHITGELLMTFFSDGTILPLPQFSAHYYFF